MSGQTAPHLQQREPVHIRRGGFWIPGERIEAPQGTVQRAALRVDWEAPAGQARPIPLVLVHGGGGQATDWLGTLDGGSGWVDHLVGAGYAVYTVDRVGHGRSPRYPETFGEAGALFTYEAAAGLFAPADAPAHTAWPWSRQIGGDALDQLVAGFGAIPPDFAESQRLDAERLGRLLDRIGPAVLVTHSAGAPSGWLTAAARPGAVRAIVAAEPLGPPFAGLPGMGAIPWGLTHAPLPFDPPAETPQQLHDGAVRVVPGLDGVPVLVVTAEWSPLAAVAQAVVDQLRAWGAEAVRLHLPDAGVRGNGHGFMFEANSAETVVPVLDWLRARGL